MSGGLMAAALYSLDLFDDRPFMRLDDIGSVVSLHVAILTKRRRFPINLLWERSDLHRIRQAIADPEPCARSCASGCASFLCSRRTRVLRMTSRSLSEKLRLRDGAAAAVDCEAGA